MQVRNLDFIIHVGHTVFTDNDFLVVLYLWSRLTPLRSQYIIVYQAVPDICDGDYS